MDISLPVHVVPNAVIVGFVIAQCDVVNRQHQVLVVIFHKGATHRGTVIDRDAVAYNPPQLIG